MLRLTLLLGVLGATLGQSVHTIFLTECTLYFQWQSMGMVYSHKKSGQPGHFSRVMCCTDEQRRGMPAQWLDEVPVHTHIAPSFTHHPRTGDVYSAYNKPEAVIDFLDKHPHLEDEWILIVDADMVLRKPFLPQHFGNLTEGWGVGAFYGYLKGVNNALADKYVPDSPPRNDTQSGQPYGRKADQVGGYVLLHVNDARRLAPDWMSFTEQVREDPDAWELTGDMYAAEKPHSRPWISEMYGYVFAAAKAGVRQIADRTSMIYPGYQPTVVPRLLHYGLLHTVDSYSFDKHWHYDFDAFACPPWDLSGRSSGGLFRHPPRPSELEPGDETYYARLLVIETVNTLNEALCERHMAHCPESQQLSEECMKTTEIMEELITELQRAEEQLSSRGLDVECGDKDSRCHGWAATGECVANPGYMSESCAKSCGNCGPDDPSAAPAAGAGQEPSEEGAPGVAPADEGTPQTNGASVALEENAVSSAPLEGRTAVPDAEQGDNAIVGEDAGGDSAVEKPKAGEGGSTAARKAPAVREALEEHVKQHSKVSIKRQGKADDAGQQYAALKKRCLEDGGLTMEEVQACLAAAETGKSYEPAPRITVVEREDGRGAAGVEDPGDDPHAQLRQQELLHAVAGRGASSHLDVSGHAPAALGVLTGWMLLWWGALLVAVVGVLTLTRRRRQKSGRRKA